MSTKFRKDIPLEKRIIFALDVNNLQKAKDWVLQLEDQVKFYKVGLELFLACGFNIVDWILNRNLEVMLDLKLFDVPQTVFSAIKQIRNRGISYTTVHGNDSILQAAVEAAGKTKILAVTVLTSLDQGDLYDLGFHCRTKDLILSRARRALRFGCAGVVSSGQEVQQLRQELSHKLFVVVPGVRPVNNYPTDDQKRIIDIKQAFEYGADHVVIGRPIKNASNPSDLVEKMQKDIAQALKE